MTEPLRTYAAADFAAPSKECDVVMKGGVTSGVVYPYAILELARVYRFRSVGGTSAGGIAAAFAAAAEYARTVRGDPAGFLRLQARSESLPGLLASLFQPAPRYAALMRFLLRAQARPEPLPILFWLVLSFWLTSAAGALAGWGLMRLAQGGWGGEVLGAALGVGIAVGVRLGLLIKGLPKDGYGLCPGLTQGGAGPALTDWLHASIQEIAFGDAEHAEPLTFGHLLGGEGNPASIDLRMITTNLSMGRPHTLPSMGWPMAYRPSAWGRLFPAPVMAYLDRVAPPSPDDDTLKVLPLGAAMPILAAVRMSLSFPFLFSVIPLWTRDYKGAAAEGEAEKPREVLFTDGGLSSNFPIHMFDAILPSRPTFALSLDELAGDAATTGSRVSIPSTAAHGIGLPIKPVGGMGAFAFALLGAAKDWQDNLLAGLPGQRDRIARVMLDRDEGGLNLTMPPARSRALMSYGLEVGERFAGGAMDFDRHRWVRTLVAYEQLEQTVAGAATVWNERGFGDWYHAYSRMEKSYRNVGKADRLEIHSRLDAFAGLKDDFTPPIAGKDGKFPRPRARLRIGPDV